MRDRTRLLVIGALLALGVIGLAMAWTQWGGQIAPAIPLLGLGTPTATVIPTITPIPTSTPTEGEMAAAIVGQEYIAYRTTGGECSQLVESGQAEACVWPQDIQIITRPEWEQLFPETHFYLIRLAGRNRVPEYDYSYNLELVAWHDGQFYTAETFDELLRTNGITTITDENRELVAKAFALMTLQDYLEEKVVFTEWEEVDMQPARHDYNYCLGAWTEIQGLEMLWCFVFSDGRLRVVSGPKYLQYHTGDYIDVPFEAVPLPSWRDYRFTGG